MKDFEIYLDDLNDEARNDFLKMAGEDYNDIAPIAIISFEEEND